MSFYLGDQVGPVSELLSCLSRLSFFFFFLAEGWGLQTTVKIKDAASPKKGVNEFGVTQRSALLTTTFLKAKVTRLWQYRHAIYHWKAQNPSFQLSMGTRSCIRVHGSGVLENNMIIQGAEIPRVPLAQQTLHNGWSTIPKIRSNDGGPYLILDCT